MFWLLAEVVLVDQHRKELQAAAVVAELSHRELLLYQVRF
jgi:hypothetical protein